VAEATLHASTAEEHGDVALDAGADVAPS
jgi:hypothetical protein